MKLKLEMNAGNAIHLPIKHLSWFSNLLKAGKPNTPSLFADGMNMDGPGHRVVEHFHFRYNIVVVSDAFHDCRIELAARGAPVFLVSFLFSSLINSSFL